MNTANSTRIIAPPPPAKRGLISGALVAVFALAGFFAAAPAAAQTIAAVITAESTDVEEGGNAVLNVDLGAVSGGEITVAYTLGSTTGVDAVLSGAGADVTDANSGSITIASGQRRGTITIGIVDDTVNESEENFKVTITASGITGAGVATITSGGETDFEIAESDPFTVAISADQTVAEADTGAAAVTAQFTVTLTGASATSTAGGDTTVVFDIAAASTAAAADYSFTPANGRLTLDTDAATPVLSGAITVTVTADNLNEAAETVVIELRANSVDPTRAGISFGDTSFAHMNNPLGRRSATLTITDDDTITATLSGSATANEGATVSTGVTVTLSGATHTADVVIAYANADATGSLTIAPGTTSGMLSLTATDDALSEDAETLSVVPGDFTATSAGQVTVAGSATLTINADSDDDITVTIAAASQAATTGGTANFTVTMSGASMAAVTVTYDTSGAVTASGDTVTIPAGQTSGNIAVAIPPGAVAEGETGMLTVTLGTITVATGGGTAMPGAANSATVTVTSDNAAARAARLEAPLASAGRGVGQLVAAAVQGRLRAVGSGAAGANSLTIAGRDMGAGAEVLAAQFLASGYATGERDLSTADLLRQSGFNLTGGAGGRGLNFWGGGDYVSAEGKHDGVEYDGDTSAFTLGIDTGWRDGLIGVAVARSDGDTDFTVTADGMKSSLETEVTSVHPYLTRRFNRSQLWLTAGYGNGDAELKEPDARIKTDLSVTTAAIGFTRAQTDRLSANLSALYTRAELDAAASGGRALPKTTADSLRVAAAAEAVWTHGAWRPFVTIALRHDSGDGATGGAVDLGGGVERRGPGVHLRLEGARHLAGGGAEEGRLNLTVRKTAGRLNLGVTVGMEDGVNTANLLSGEWQF